MRTSRIVMLVIGVLLAVLGFGLVVGGGILGGAYLTQRDDDGFFTTPTERFQTDSYALTTEAIDLSGAADIPSFLSPEDFGRVVLRAESTNDATPIFIGIARAADVERYLNSVAHEVITDVDFDPFRVERRRLSGGAPAGPPTAQGFWAASASGTGRQELTWDVEDGTWTAVTMNANGATGVSARIEAGGRFDILGPIAIGLLAAGAVSLAIGVPLLVVGAAGLGRHQAPPAHPVAPSAAGAPLPPPPATVAPVPSHHATVIGYRYPARLTGELDSNVSRWQWLVKWLLAIPHWIVLFFLWIAWFVITFIAGVAILFTGRYPRSLFDFSVGVMRWTWRVEFYAYSALGTDRYPPFTLGRTDYPADFEVDYPERLSRGLVLVKWWLLAIPHYLVLAVIGGPFGWGPLGWSRGADDTPGTGWWFGFGLIGILVIIAAFALLFTGRYPLSLFNFVMGLNRWTFRVWTYAGLLRDEYPPFRLDSGPHEPAAEPASGAQPLDPPALS